jgi:hypothetical protein
MRLYRSTGWFCTNRLGEITLLPDVAWAIFVYDDDSYGLFILGAGNVARNGK